MGLSTSGKSETSQIFKAFHRLIQTWFETHIRTLRANNGKEYFNSILGDYLLENGIIYQSSRVDTLQQNGVSKRKNRQLFEVVLVLLFTKDVPKYLCVDVVLTAAYLTNHLSNHTINFKATYLQVFKSNTLPFRTSGCTAFGHIHDDNRNKLDHRAQNTIFIGYSPTQKVYSCYCPQNKKIYVTCDVTFFEDTPYFSSTSLQGEKHDEACCPWDTRLTSTRCSYYVYS